MTYLIAKTVTYICERYLNARKMSETADDYYISFTHQVAPADVMEWEEQIKDAEKRRIKDRTVMDIIGATKPDSERMQTVDVESSGGPIVEWIQLAIIIEEKQ
jgi:hypothetical protein